MLPLIGQNRVRSRGTLRPASPQDVEPAAATRKGLVCDAMTTCCDLGGACSVRTPAPRRARMPATRIALNPVVVALVLGCSGTKVSVPPAPPSPPPSLVGFPAFQKAFEDSARANGVLGAQLAISIPGRPLWSTEYGEERPGLPMAADVLLGTGSISKMLAAVGALRLVDRGLLSFSDTAGRWFPGIAGVPPGIRLQAMLWHQSGLAEYGSAPGYSAAVFADLQRDWQPEDLLAFIGSPIFPVGTAWAASNTDRLLLSIISAKTTNLPYGEYLARELFNSGEGGVWTPGQARAAAPRIEKNWGRTNAGTVIDYSAAFFGPSLFTSRLETYLTARELALFARRMFDGDLLSPAARTHLLTIVPDDARIPGQTGGGVGIRRFEYFGRTQYGNSGATANSSAIYLYDARTKVIVAMSTNQEGGMHGNSHFRIVPALIQAVNAWLAGGDEPMAPRAP